MGSEKNLMKRKEKKYFMTEQRYRILMEHLKEYIVPDEYPHSSTCSMYYDTPDFRLIRESNEKPKYKQKLRVRSYGVPTPDQTVFVEIKKKFKGVVYKRRVCMTLRQAEEFLRTGHLDVDRLAEDDALRTGNNPQILKEIEYMLSFYDHLQPAMMISYERDSYYAKDDPDLRFTFDSGITYRTDHLDLTEGVFGSQLIRPDQHLMEIKINGAMPVWLARVLDQSGVFSASFTKYGNAYRQVMTGGSAMKGVYINA